MAQRGDRRPTLPGRRPSTPRRAGRPRGRCACPGRTRRRCRRAGSRARWSRNWSAATSQPRWPAVHHARAQCRPAAATERVPRLGAGDAVDEQPAVLLERSHSSGRERALHAVYRHRVEADCLECHLKRGHVGAARSRRLRETQRKRPCEDDHAGDLPDVTHTLGVGAFADLPSAARDPAGADGSAADGRERARHVGRAHRRTPVVRAAARRSGPDDHHAVALGREDSAGRCEPRRPCAAAGSERRCRAGGSRPARGRHDRRPRRSPMPRESRPLSECPASRPPRATAPPARNAAIVEPNPVIRISILRMTTNAVNPFFPGRGCIPPIERSTTHHVTSVDVARRAGVSQSTVSLVFSGKGRRPGLGGNPGARSPLRARARLPAERRRPGAAAGPLARGRAARARRDQPVLQPRAARRPARRPGGRLHGGARRHRQRPSLGGAVVRGAARRPRGRLPALRGQRSRRRWAPTSTSC